jgi:hypothetical protein
MEPIRMRPALESSLRESSLETLGELGLADAEIGHVHREAPQRIAIN